MKKTLIIGATLLALVIGQSVSAESNLSHDESNSIVVVTSNKEVKFQDIEGHWAQSDIEFMVGEGVLHGYPDGTFEPNGTITRAEFSKVLADLMEAKGENNTFADTEGHWAESVINGLVDEGVIETYEYPNGFEPNEQITRLEMSKMVARGLAKESLFWNEVLTGLKELDAIDLPFTDQSEMSLADIPYITLANSSGIISGYEDGSFRMERSATRAEATVMLKRYLDAKNKKPVLSELLEKFKGEPSIHNYSKEEMEAWIDKEA